MSDDSTTRKSAQGRTARRRLLWIVAACVGLAVVLSLVVYVPVRATSTSAYCSSCHQMKDAKATWQRSIHGRVACVSCHVPRGLTSSVAWRSREWVNIWATYLHMSNVSEKQQVPANANCTSCHPVSRIVTSQVTVRMTHALHVNLRGLRCVDCHTGVSHARLGESVTVSMTVCTMCHSQAVAQNQCTFCHKTTPPKNAHPADFIALHGKQALENQADCLRCHHSTQSFCDPCHAKPPADHYSGTWRSTHASAARADPATCVGCHDNKTFCQRCHQVDHPPNWVGIHGPVAAQGSASCLVCHQRSFCDECHARAAIRQ